MISIGILAMVRGFSATRKQSACWATSPPWEIPHDCCKIAIALTIPVLSAAIYDMSSRLPSMPKSCEVIEVRNSADELGLPCSRTASMQCSDCGSELCESHTETCGICNAIFCPSCLSFHLVQHPKAASADHRQVRERKRA